MLDHIVEMKLALGSAFMTACIYGRAHNWKCVILYCVPVAHRP